MLFHFTSLICTWGVHRTKSSVDHEVLIGLAHLVQIMIMSKRVNEALAIPGVKDIV